MKKLISLLLAAALAMLGLGCCADKESRKGNKAHKAPADTVQPKSRRKAGGDAATDEPDTGRNGDLAAEGAVR